MTRKDKLAVMFYKAMALYLTVYPKERKRLRKLTRRPSPLIPR
jgi:hypothetical protein